jgi:hypothetical protein
MHLYLRENPRTLYIVTSSQEENSGRPRRALVFRAAEDNPYQAVVEFLPKDQVNLSNSIRLTSRVVKGCLGLICVTDGAPMTLFALVRLLKLADRSLPCRYYLRHGDWEHKTDGRLTGIHRQDPRSQLLLFDVFCMG